METQPAVAAGPVTGNARLQRDSWKAEAIRRGQLKISGPIPLDDDDVGMALTKRHTDPMTSQVADEVSLQDSEQQRDAHSDGDEPLPADWEKDKKKEADRSVRERRHHHLSKSIELPIMETRHQHHASLDPTVSFNNQGTTAFAEGLPNMKGKKKRRSGLRSVFRKMFGRKSRDEGKREGTITRQDHFTDTEPAISQQAKERDEAAAARAAAARNARDFSIPLEQLELRMPLGSHLPFPMNVNAPVEISPPHDYLTFDSSQPPRVVGHRRRATLPSVIFSSADAAALTAGWFADDAHVVSPIEQGLAVPSAAQEPEIGIAVSGPVNLKRRSRSAGALRDMVKDQSSQIEFMPTVVRTERRRSAEIRYWRSSGMARSISDYSESKNAGKGETGKEAAEESGADDQSAANRDTIVLDPEHIRAFNFGNFSASSVNSHEIERTPTMTEQSTVSYDETPLREEENQLFVEQASPVAIRRADQPIILDEPPKGKRNSREDNSSGNSTNRVIGPYQTPTAPLSALQPATFLNSPSPTNVLNHQPTTTTTTTTTFPNISSTSFNVSSHPSYTDLHSGAIATTPTLDALKIHLPTLSSPDISTLTASSTTPLSTYKAAEQFAAIYTILRHERSARKALEQQVLALTRELADLRALNAAQQTQTHLGRPKRTSADEEKRQTVISRFSTFDSGDEAEDDEAAGKKGGVGDEEERGEAEAGAETDDAASARSPELFETPREEAAPYGFGFGGVSGQMGQVQVGRPVVVEGGKF